MEPFKNRLSGEVARRIGAAVGRGYPAFDSRAFVRDMDAALAPLELKARMHHIADRLEQSLPGAPAELFPILERALAEGPEDEVGLRGFPVWPLTEIISRRGHDTFDLAMHAMREMTQRFTGEFAIRAFLRNQETKTLAQLMVWATDPDEHVRRLASEGSRPLLPWGERLPHLLANPELTLPILDLLHDDPSEYVRRSVANHLNDFSRTHPKHVIATLCRWGTISSGTNFPKTIARAARTLVKAGNSEALALMGYSTDAALELVRFEITPGSLNIGDALTYSVEIKNPSPAIVPAIVDYVIFHRKANGSLSRKVFKGRRRTIPAHTSWQFSAKHSFRPVTTRKYYAGTHRIELLINGNTRPGSEFELMDA
jgi:3-methyladenine DNA glycosylase AlkC